MVFCKILILVNFLPEIVILLNKLQKNKPLKRLVLRAYKVIKKS